MNRRAAALCLLFVLGAAVVARAQEVELEEVLNRLGTAWEHGDAGALAALAAHAGLSIEILGERVGPLSKRQVAAVLRRVFERRETIALRHGMAQVVGGTPPRAFGELAWITRVEGTTIPERATIFIALIREDEGWRVTQIRLLR
ncbi:MAG TPA: hypothetical protein VF188_00290 [Longimicrobiales bacterium]